MLKYMVLTTIIIFTPSSLLGMKPKLKHLKLAHKKRAASLASSSCPCTLRPTITKKEVFKDALEKTFCFSHIYWNIKPEHLLLNIALTKNKPQKLYEELYDSLLFLITLDIASPFLGINISNEEVEDFPTYFTHQLSNFKLLNEDDCLQKRQCRLQFIKAIHNLIPVLENLQELSQNSDPHKRAFDRIFACLETIAEQLCIEFQPPATE